MTSFKCIFLFKLYQRRPTCNHRIVKMHTPTTIKNSYNLKVSLHIQVGINTSLARRAKCISSHRLGELLSSR